MEANSSAKKVGGESTGAGDGGQRIKWEGGKARVLGGLKRKTGRDRVAGEYWQSQ